MATVTKGRTFVSGETVTPTKLNDLVDLATVTAIQTADISDSAVTNAKIASGVDASKLTTGTLPSDRIGSDAITTARINNAAVTAAKLDGAQAGSAPIYGCRAWVNFDGTKDTTGATSTANTNRLIRASGNVASVLRNGLSDYTVTFTTAMQDANYSVVMGPADDVRLAFSIVSQTAGSFTIQAGGLLYSNGAVINVRDIPNVPIAIFR